MQKTHKGSKKKVEPTDFNTIWEMYEHCVSAHGDNVALQMWNDGKLSDILTFKSLHQKALSNAEILKQYGIQPGDRIAIIGENHCDWVALFLSIMCCQATAVLIEPKLEAEDYISLINKADPTLIFMSDSCFKKLPEAKIPDLPILDMHNRFVPLNTETRNETLRHASDGDPTVAIIIFTSGTTGEFKGVMLEHKAVLSAVEYPIEKLDGGIGHQVLNILPFTHVFGIVASLLIPLFCAQTLTIIDKIIGENILKAMRITKTDTIPCVPRLIELFYSNILNKIKEQKPKKFGFIKKMIHSLAHLREKLNVNLGRTIFAKVHHNFGGYLNLFVSGGAQIEQPVYQGMSGLGFTILEGYGLSETCGPIFCASYRKPLKGSVGQCAKNAQVKILAEKNGQPGEILYKGPSLMKGYFRDPEATAQAMVDGWFHTGDIGRLDKHGNLFITGRIKEIIVTSSGEKAMPMDVESRYKDSPSIQEIAVFGAPSGFSTAEDIHAAVVVKEEIRIQHGDHQTIHQIISEEIFRKSEHVPAHLRIHHIHIIDVIPKTTTLKVKRNELKNTLQQPLEKCVSAFISISEIEPESVDTENTHIGHIEDQTAKKVIELVKKTALTTNQPYPHEINERTSFITDLSFDSLSVLELIFAIEEEFGVRLGAEPLEKIQTVENLIQLVKSKTKGGISDRDKQKSKSKSKRFKAQIHEHEQILEKSKNLKSLNFKSKKHTGNWAKKLFNLFYTLEVKGKDWLNQSKPFILIANHSSHLDTISILTATGIDFDDFVVLSAKDYFFKDDKPKTILSKIFNMLPFDRDNTTQAIIDNLVLCKKCLEKKKNLLLFPEGTRSLDGKLQPFKSFMAIAAGEFDLPIIPAYIKGTHELFPKGNTIPRFGKITVVFGEPLIIQKHFTNIDQLSDVELYQAITAEIQSRVIGLKDTV